MYYRGKMFGFVHLYNGQEAVSTGVIKQLRKDDYVTSTYRDHVHAISKGCAPREVMAELFGKTTGVCRGQGGSMHMFSKEWGVLGGYAFIGEGIPVRFRPAFYTARPAVLTSTRRACFARRRWRRARRSGRATFAR
jgi:pyruvate dehydrogenase E1 component alpha subunit